jgi:hypothetical protein
MSNPCINNIISHLQQLREKQSSAADKFVNYRESVLTQLFKSFFIGNGTVRCHSVNIHGASINNVTNVIWQHCTMHDNNLHHNNTIDTLNYCCRYRLFCAHHNRLPTLMKHVMCWSLRRWHRNSRQQPPHFVCLKYPK